ncbi:hypothetical protein WDZ17_07825 [Pseudokineococcus basanitobsidens]|uniref:Polyketide cyclase/dehydrase/lipid transport protein n=1 Tax=Pseudokineococcus basanitobsidens TaxID=1926649 RepID=A0ABU8RJE8_9ACTN
MRATSLPEVLVPGARGEVSGPLGVRVHAQVGHVDHDGRSWSWTVRLARPALPRVALHLEHAVAGRAGAAGGAVTSLVLTGHPVVVLAYALPARLALGRLVRP